MASDACEMGEWSVGPMPCCRRCTQDLYLADRGVRRTVAAQSSPFPWGIPRTDDLDGWGTVADLIEVERLRRYCGLSAYVVTHQFGSAEAASGGLRTS